MATRRRDLRSGAPVWAHRAAPRVASRPLVRDLRADVLVVGAGISGALIADALTAAGRHVLVLDRRGPMLGATAASTALLLYELDLPLRKLARRIGRSRAERLWRRSRLALDALRERQRHLGIRADAVNRDGLYLQGSSLDADELRVEAQARRRAGFECTFLSAREVARLYGIRKRAALRSYDNLEADPRRLTSGFLRAAIQRGARVLAPVEVTAIEASRAGVAAGTRGGPVIHARQLVFASGYELPQNIPLGHRHSIQSTWVIATEPQPRSLWPTRCLLWEASDPYLYLRTSPAGRVICGGEDEPFSDAAHRDALLGPKTEILQRKLAALLPCIKTHPQFRWCASFGTTPTGSPSIGPLPRLPNCYAALGYGGNGITFSMLAAQVLRGLIAGDGDPDADLVSFTRKF